ncbi:50S ribosomal protein L3 [Candidatus Palauibacter sp.]|uniref:50S ribosomal protein L3 n=1 Tax=Candidatus Palauibacter sp. TaxID=3101350 RepID=UPI003B02068D
MPGLIGRKIGMTQIFDDDGRAVGVTVLEVGPCPVVQIKTAARDGYDAVQLGFGRVKESNVRRPARKPAKGHAARAGLDHVPRVLAEFDFGSEELEPGQQLTVDMFEVGSRVDVSGTTKGRGFQGVVKRHGFAGGRGSHGGSSVLRKPGSIGAGTDPSRVIKGVKMAGRMGGTKHMAMSRRVIRVDAEKNLLIVCGSIPGARNNIVMVRSGR